jgi:trans-2,3-dihydro-3-hydroxyanthranilate isomerase
VSHAIHIVDVFAEEKYAGNQLAVVLEAGDISPERMQTIARETNFSETTFITSGEETNGGYPVRIFTPGVELPFAGHPTLGTAWVIRRHLTAGAGDTVRLNLKVGQILVTFEPSDGGRELLWLTAPPIEPGPICDVARMASALGLAVSDIDDTAPIQQLVAGSGMVFVPIRNLEALRRARFDVAAFAPLAAEGFNPYVYLFCRETISDEDDLCARFFFDALGMREDPATGSATAMLGAYLLEHRYFPQEEISLRIEQGYEIHRPSLLRLKARGSGASRQISVGGHVIPVMEGKLL